MPLPIRRTYLLVSSSPRRPSINISQQRKDVAKQFPSCAPTASPRHTWKYTAQRLPHPNCYEQPAIISRKKASKLLVVLPLYPARISASVKKPASHGLTFKILKHKTTSEK